MEFIHVKFVKLHPDAVIPVYSTPGSSGLDLSARLDEDIVIEPLNWAIIPTGIAIELPHGFEAQVRSRSGLAAKHGVFVLNSPGTIDSDYRGEIKIILYNLGKEPFVVKHGMRIAQLVVCRYVNVSLLESDSLRPTTRADGGFGHTGV